MKGMSLHQAILKTSGSQIIDQLAEIAQRKGFEVKRESGQVKINAPLGEVAGGDVVPWTHNSAPKVLCFRWHGGLLAFVSW